MENHNIEKFQKKIKQLHEETTAYVNEIKTLISSSFQSNELKILSYFTYTTNITHERESESLIIGTYHIHNIGNTSINKPYICLKLSKSSPFHFSGKYINKNTTLSMQTNDIWERLNDHKNKEEYWLKPIGKESIAPEQIISFSNFQAKWLPSEPYTGSIMGFTYCDEFNDGIPSINQINLSGN